MAHNASQPNVSVLTRNATRYFANAVQDEVLARLRFLIDHHRRLGLLLGPSGSGKTTVLQVLAEQQLRAGRQVVLTSLLGRENGEFIASLASGLGTYVPDGAQGAVLWRQIGERLRENQYQQRPTVFLLDDADEAEMDLLTSTLRLIHSDLAHPSHFTVIVACHSSRAQLLGPRIRELCELRIELEPWGWNEIQAYAQAHSHELAAFTDAAISHLQELSGGVPRRVAHLTELTLLATAGCAGTIDADTVQTAYSGLSGWTDGRDQ